MYALQLSELSTRLNKADYCLTKVVTKLALAERSAQNTIARLNLFN